MPRGKVPGWGGRGRGVWRWDGQQYQGLERGRCRGMWQRPEWQLLSCAGLCSASWLSNKRTGARRPRLASPSAGLWWEHGVAEGAPPGPTPQGLWGQPWGLGWGWSREEGVSAALHRPQPWCVCASRKGRAAARGEAAQVPPAHGTPIVSFRIPKLVSKKAFPPAIVGCKSLCGEGWRSLTTHRVLLAVAMGCQGARPGH